MGVSSRSRSMFHPDGISTSSPSSGNYPPQDSGLLQRRYPSSMGYSITSSRGQTPVRHLRPSMRILLLAEFFPFTTKSMYRVSVSLRTQLSPVSRATFDLVIKVVFISCSPELVKLTASRVSVKFMLMKVFRSVSYQRSETSNSMRSKSRPSAQ